MASKLPVPYFKQNRDFTCGPACLRMVLEYFGVEQDEVTLAILCGTNLAGTGLAEIAEAAQRLGLEADWKINASLQDIKDALKKNIPVMAMIDARVLHHTDAPFVLGHAVVIVAYLKSEIYFHDPLIGEDQRASVSVFSGAWTNMRKGMVIVWKPKKT